MKVSYPAIFYEEKIGNYTVFFPDFQQVTCGDDLADAEFMAKDCLSLLITIEKEDRHKKHTAPKAETRYRQSQMVHHNDQNCYAF